jgi:hypothetical protein
MMIPTVIAVPARGALIEPAQSPRNRGPWAFRVLALEFRQRACGGCRLRRSSLNKKCSKRKSDLSSRPTRRFRVS